MQSACVFCGAALTAATRAPQPSPLTRSGFVTSRRSWCVACDDATAPQRARALLEAARRRATRDARLAYLRDYNARPEVQARKRELKARAAWRAGRTSFRCAGCGGRFARAREAWRLQDGHRVRLGLCRYCAERLVGPSRHEAKAAPREGWAAYLRAYRARRRAAASDKGEGTRKPQAA